MECIEVSSPTLVLTKRSVFDCLPFKRRKWIQFGVFNKVNYIPSKIFFNKVPHQVALLGLIEPFLNIFSNYYREDKSILKSCQVAGFGGRRLLRKEKKDANFIPWQKPGTWKIKSLMYLFMNRFQAHIYQCDTKCKNRETHTNKSTHKRHKDTTSLRKGTTDDVSTNKFTGWKIRIWRINYTIKLGLK